MRLAINGGSKVREHSFASRIRLNDADRLAANRVLASGSLSEFVGAGCDAFMGGQEIKGFEFVVGERFKAKHAISVNSWTTGLQTCFGAIGLEPGDEVICPPYTMSASATAALSYGGVPVFADIDKWRLTVSPMSIRERITSKTKAIVVVHLLGCPADMDGILAIADQYGLCLIEDAAQSPGARYKGKEVGSIGQIGGFSFNYHKHIQCGEGGVIVTNDDSLARRCSLIRNHGENAIEKDEVLANSFGSNFRLTEIQAAIASSQLARLDSILQKRSILAKRIITFLESTDGLDTTVIEDGSMHSYYMFPIFFDHEELGFSRSQFLKAVLAELPTASTWDQTALTEGYVKPLYWSRMYQERIALGGKGFPFSLGSQKGRESYNHGSCPITEEAYRKRLLLTPLVHECTEPEDVDDLCKAIEKVLGARDEVRSIHSGGDSQVYDPVAAIDSYISK